MKFIFQDVKYILQDAECILQDVECTFRGVQYKTSLKIGRKEIKALPKGNRGSCEAGSCSNGGHPLLLFR